MSKVFVEQDCTVEHESRKFTSGGAVVIPETIVAYVGKIVDGRRELTDWHGNKIGTIRLASSWATPRSYVSSCMYQAYATVNGVQYTGRTVGEGMAFKGKRVKGV
jgi:hypothetical protein